MSVCPHEAGDGHCLDCDMNPGCCDTHDVVQQERERIAAAVEGLACYCTNHADCQPQCHVWNDDRQVSLGAVLDLIYER